MRSAFAVDAVVAAEQACDGGAALADGTLMARAAYGLAGLALDLLRSGPSRTGRGTGVVGARVVLLVGTGDNGGDTLHAGALLARRGARVDAVATGEPHAAGLAALHAAGGRLHAATVAQVPVLLAAADLVLDGLVGIGARGPLREPAATLVGLLPADSRVLAVDLPSGVDANTGEVSGAAVSAAATATFGALKPGLLVAPGAHRAGRVQLVELGLGPHLASPALESLTAEDVRGLLRPARPTDDKYARGVLGVAAGSAAYSGAGALTVEGALGAGLGMVRFVGDPVAAQVVRTRCPEVIVTDETQLGGAGGAGRGPDLAAAGRVQAWVCGPGGRTDELGARLVGAVLAQPVPVVLDASVLQVLAEHADLRAHLAARRAATVLTPHAGELARLLGAERAEVEAAGLRHVRRAADELGATVLLKGSTTLVADPGGAEAVRVNPVATPWLASAGSGDVLAGVVGALLASGLAARDAASAAAWLHAAAGERAAQGGPLRASQVATALPRVVAAVLDTRGQGHSTP